MATTARSAMGSRSTGSSHRLAFGVFWTFALCLFAAPVLADSNDGDYEVGVAATDTGLSVASTVTADELDRIVTVFGPIIRVVAP